MDMVYDEVEKENWTHVTSLAMTLGLTFETTKEVTDAWVTLAVMRYNEMGTMVGLAPGMRLEH